MLECVCGESLVLTASEAVCRWGADHTALVREERASDGGTHPWDDRVPRVAEGVRRIRFGRSISRLAEMKGHPVVKKGEYWEASWLPSGRSGLVHYVIARRETTGFELPHTFFHLGKEVLPVFSSAEAARRFLASLALRRQMARQGVLHRRTGLAPVHTPQEGGVGPTQPPAGASTGRRCAIAADAPG